MTNTAQKIAAHTPGAFDHLCNCGRGMYGAGHAESCPKFVIALKEQNSELLRLLWEAKQHIYQGVPDGWIDHGIDCAFGTEDANCTCGLSDWIKSLDAALAKAVQS